MLTANAIAPAESRIPATVKPRGKSSPVFGVESFLPVEPPDPLLDPPEPPEPPEPEGVGVALSGAGVGVAVGFTEGVGVAVGFGTGVGVGVAS